MVEPASRSRFQRSENLQHSATRGVISPVCCIWPTGIRFEQDTFAGIGFALFLALRESEILTVLAVVQARMRQFVNQRSLLLDHVGHVLHFDAVLIAAPKAAAIVRHFGLR